MDHLTRRAAPSDRGTGHDTILAIDLGTSTIKAVLWGADGPLAEGRAALTTHRPRPGWAVQDASDWWDRTVAACAQARAAAPVAWRAVRAIGFSVARETFVPLGADGEPLTDALVWSDRRAVDEADDLVDELGGADATHARTGLVVDPGCQAAKWRWLERRRPEVAGATRHLAGPRELVVARLTGRLVTDTTVASRSGFQSLDGTPLPGADRLPPVVPPTTIVGIAGSAGAAALGLPPGVPVVTGAGDRACEVVGVDATTARPMVSWGTTANVTAPVRALTHGPPRGIVVSVGVDGLLLECGLSAAGAALRWLATITGHGERELAEAAAGVPAGAGGVVALCWFDGARAPWWEPQAQATLTGLRSDTTVAELARAIYEGVAADLVRGLERIEAATAVPVTELAAAGGGTRGGPWIDVLAGVTGRPVSSHRSGEAGSAGACRIAARAVGLADAFAGINPVVHRTTADPATRSAYRAARARSDDVAHRLLAGGGPYGG